MLVLVALETPLVTAPPVPKKVVVETRVAFTVVRSTDRRRVVVVVVVVALVVLKEEAQVGFGVEGGFPGGAPIPASPVVPVEFTAQGGRAGKSAEGE